jgi:hypothetical protein
MHARTLVLSTFSLHLLDAWERIRRIMVQAGLASATCMSHPESGCRDPERAEQLCTELHSIADAWYTRNKWPRGRVTYTKLFLPAVHIAIAIGFTADYLFNKLRPSTIQSARMNMMGSAGGPLRSWLGQPATKTFLHAANIHLPNILQDYGFYIIFVPVFLSMMVCSTQMLACKVAESE